MDGAVKVLVIEDNPVDARVVTEFLTPGEGFEVTHVGCLSEASAALGEGGYDAVLLDLMLPDSHGLATVGIDEATSLLECPKKRLRCEDLLLERVGNKLFQRRGQ